MKRLMLALLVLVALGGGARLTFARRLDAQAAGLCILTYIDTNENGARDTGEPTLPNVSASLKSGEVVVANLFIAENATGQACFKNVQPGTYTLEYSSPFARAVTPLSVPLTVKAGETAILEFGGAAVGSGASAANTIIIPLTRPVRLVMALGGALIVMGMMLGLGLIIRNIQALWRRQTPTR